MPFKVTSQHPRKVPAPKACSILKPRKFLEIDYAFGLAAISPQIAQISTVTDYLAQQGSMRQYHRQRLQQDLVNVAMLHLNRLLELPDATRGGRQNHSSD